jgi:hypothetical protein
MTSVHAAFSSLHEEGMTLEPATRGRQSTSEMHGRNQMRSAEAGSYQCDGASAGRALKGADNCPR